MSKVDWDKFNKVVSEFHDCISTARIGELRKIDQTLDDLKNLVEDNIDALAGHGGDY